MHNSIELHEFSILDKAEFLAMAHDFYASGAALDVVPEMHFERTFEQFFIDSKLKGLAVCVDNAIAGYCIIAFFWSNEFGGNVAFLDELYIKPALRGKRIGTRTLDEIKRYAAELDCAAVRLEVNPDHPNTVRLYARNGFCELGYTQMLCKL